LFAKGWLGRKYFIVLVKERKHVFKHNKAHSGVCGNIFEIIDKGKAKMQQQGKCKNSEYYFSKSFHARQLLLTSY
jgi:hypothetical protein